MPASFINIFFGILKSLQVTYMSPVAPETLTTCIKYIVQNHDNGTKKLTIVSNIKNTATGASAIKIYVALP